MRRLPPPGIGDRGDRVSSHPHRSREVVSDRPRQVRGRGQVPAAELDVAYQTAWTMVHKLRHGLSEDPARSLLDGFLEADDTFIGGRGDSISPGRSTRSPDKSLAVGAVEKGSAPNNNRGKHGHAVKHQHGFVAGDARIAVLPTCCRPPPGPNSAPFSKPISRPIRTR
jgi:hypothetical protein